MTGSGCEKLPYFAVTFPWASMTWSRSARVQHAISEPWLPLAVVDKFGIDRAGLGRRQPQC